jgi:DNA-binding SARP family transcriptional activator
VRVALLDGFTLDTGETVRRAGDLLPHGVQRLVAHVSLARRSVRSVVAGQLWPEVPEGRAHGSLRSALWRVQKVAPGLLEVRGDMLALAAGVQVDVRELAAWAARVSDPAAPVDEFPAAHDRLTGELLPGWYDDWVLLERERLRQLRMHALERLADRLAAVRRYGEALQAAHAAVLAEPLRESAHRAVVRVHLAEGNVSEAARAFDAFRTMLADELGVAPSRQMIDLLHRLPEPRRLAQRRPVPAPAGVPAR